MYSLHQQYLDMASGFHVIELRDERGNRHLIQLAVGHDACPACGAVHPKDNLGSLDPAAAVAPDQRGPEYVTATDACLRRQARAHGEDEAHHPAPGHPRRLAGIQQLHREHQAAQGTNYELP